MDKIITEVSKLYSLDIQDFYKPSGGSISNNHILICTQGEFFLKEFIYDDEFRINSICEVVKLFSENNLPVIPFILNKDGKYFKYEDKFYALMPKVEGIVVKQKDMLDQLSAQSAGYMLARIHKVTHSVTDFSKFYKRDYDGKLDKFRISTEYFKNLLENKSRDDFDQLALDDIYLKIRLANEIDYKFSDLEFDKKYIIHGDYHQGNFFFDENKNIKYFFDLDQSSISPRLLEVFKFIDFLYFKNEEWSTYAIQHFISAYFNELPFTKKELSEAIKGYVYKGVHTTWIQEGYYTKNNGRVAKFLHDNYKSLKFLYYNINETTDLIWSLINK